MHICIPNNVWELIIRTFTRENSIQINDFFSISSTRSNLICICLAFEKNLAQSELQHFNICEHNFERHQYLLKKKSIPCSYVSIF